MVNDVIVINFTTRDQEKLGKKPHKIKIRENHQQPLN